MSDGAPKRLLLYRSSIDVDGHLLAVHAVVYDADYFTKSFANLDDVAFADDRSGRNGDRRTQVFRVGNQARAGNVRLTNDNINIAGIRHGITSFRRRGYAGKTGGVPAGSWS